MDLSGTSTDTAAFHQALARIVSGKSIVGFGEATHGTAEFERAFALITRKLVREQGFNVVVFAEMNFADTWQLNKYVLQDSGETEVGFHTPYTFLQEDRLQLIEWIHAYNRGKPAHEKVWFMGADVNTPNGAAHNALLYCSENDISLPTETRAALTAIAQLPLYSQAEALRDSTSLKNILAKLAPLYQLVQQHASQQDSLDLRQLWLAQSIASLNSALKSYYAVSHTEDPFRDSTMYSNLKWVLAQRPDAKMLVYAHNKHIEKKLGISDLSPDLARLGWHINQHHQKAFAVIGTEAWKGKYVYSAEGEATDIVNKAGKIGTTLAKATATPVGLIHLNATPELTDFFNRKHTITVGIASPASMYSRTKELAEAFDAILYVRESSPIKIRELYGFNLALELDRAKHANMLKSNSLILAGATSYTTLDSYQPGKGVKFTVNFLNKDKELISFKAAPVLPDSKLDHEFVFPDATAYVLLSFTGEKVQEFSLADLTINGIPAKEKDLILSSKSYKKSYYKGNNMQATSPTVIRVSL
ncbi:Erythromycin esterase homolog [Pontibacter akesuensis]|uniref:Erythromycin esterase homolog n=2 Tax=Pontibacter akesuensis TaxID=388950 RepID=A0A1I7I7Y9_9BACT|nr:hypothetical protein GCM10007389_18160 [Pontibacter akesuensis]SFU68896.1 Erythromycin esterase homolog [Pontibacter akesuensis]